MTVVDDAGNAAPLDQPAAGLAGEPLAAALTPLLSRRSANALAGPGPDDRQLEALLEAAATVPDHGWIRPYRFVVVRGDGRQVLGRALVAAAMEADPLLDTAAAGKLAAKTRIAPVMVLLVAAPDVTHKVAVWEQVATASCAGFGLVLAADLAGFGAMWKSAPWLSGRALSRLLGLTETERLLGWVNLGTRAGSGPGRRPAEARRLATRLDGDTVLPWS
ncbi:MAG: putative nitroreductase [Frankiales bacterium]|nr:putative nitroreductase [Frankiales bacterium]